MAPGLLILHAVFTAGIGALSSGCVIPTPLEASPGSNLRPVIVKASLDPPFAKDVTFSGDTPREFHVEAEDPDVDDQLYAVLARTTPNGNVNGVLKIPLLPAGGETITLRSGTFPPIKCDSLRGTAMDSSFNVRVVVSDRDFAEPITTDVRTDGSTDEVFWVARCQ